MQQNFSRAQMLSTFKKLAENMDTRLFAETVFGS